MFSWSHSIYFVACAGLEVFGCASATRAPEALTLELARQRVEITLPSGWKMLADESDARGGLVAFAPPDTTLGRSDSAFLDATEVQFPGSLDEAVVRASATDDCDLQGACRELSRASLPDRSLQVSIRRPHEIFVERWLAGPGGRVVRCGAESSDRSALSTPTWMADAAAVERIRLAAEDICRSVRLLR